MGLQYRLNWDSDKPIRYLPPAIRHFFEGEANYLFDDLRWNRLTVILVPAPYPMHQSHMIRATVSKNPEWYRDLYASQPISGGIGL